MGDIPDLDTKPPVKHQSTLCFLIQLNEQDITLSLDKRLLAGASYIANRHVSGIISSHLTHFFHMVRRIRRSHLNLI